MAPRAQPPERESEGARYAPGEGSRKALGAAKRRARPSPCLRAGLSPRYTARRGRASKRVAS